MRRTEPLLLSAHGDAGEMPAGRQCWLGASHSHAAGVHSRGCLRLTRPALQAMLPSRTSITWNRPAPVSVPCALTRGPAQRTTRTTATRAASTAAAPALTRWAGRGRAAFLRLCFQHGARRGWSSCGGRELLPQGRCGRRLLSPVKDAGSGTGSACASMGRGRGVVSSCAGPCALFKRPPGPFSWAFSWTQAWAQSQAMQGGWGPAMRTLQ